MNKNSAPTESQTILITGVSTGIGRGIAEKLLSAGHYVYGSVRSVDAANTLKAVLGDYFTPLVFDICNQNQINAAKDKLATLLAGKPLHAIINNAGSAEIGPLLYSAPDNLLHHLDVLVVGQMRVIQAFHPFLCLSNSKPGRIFNISSVSGVGPNIFFGGYSAGKHALEGLSKTLRLELLHYGTKVIVIAPGNIATEIWSKQTEDLINKYEDTDVYRPLKNHMNYIKNNIIKSAMTIEEFSTLFCEIYANPNPANRYTISISRKWRFPFSIISKPQARTIID